MLINCPHCGCPYDPHDGYELAGFQTVEVIDNVVYIVTVYQCPECREQICGTQKGAVEYWEPEEFKSV